ncbi:MAG: DUF1643 domain-containing protein [Nitrospirales bacterium]
MNDAFALSEATISPCGKYRYWLERKWSAAPPLVFIMLNPSTADASVDDPTIRRCCHFAKREGAGGLIVVNLFAYRATDPKELDGADIMAGNAVGKYAGSENTQNIGMAMLAAMINGRPVVCAWGSSKHAPKMADRIKARAKDFEIGLVCFKINKDGQPKHPLYVSGEAPLITYE